MESSKHQKNERTDRIGRAGKAGRAGEIGDPRELRELEELEEPCPQSVLLPKTILGLNDQSLELFFAETQREQLLPRLSSPPIMRGCVNFSFGASITSHAASVFNTCIKVLSVAGLKECSSLTFGCHKTWTCNYNAEVVRSLWW